MGTACAPSYANLFLAYMEEKITTDYPDLAAMAKMWARFIDDGFWIWAGPENELSRFLSVIENFYPEIKWTFEISEKCMDFLDVHVSLRQDDPPASRYIHHHSSHFTTRTFEKPSHLYLYIIYIPYTSAHPPGVLRGLVFGGLTRLFPQHSLWGEFKQAAIRFFNRLLLRGYSEFVLRGLFQQAFKRLWEDKETVTRQSSIIPLKLAYHPQAPSSIHLRQMGSFNDLTSSLAMG